MAEDQLHGGPSVVALLREHPIPDDVLRVAVTTGKVVGRAPTELAAEVWGEALGAVIAIVAAYGDARAELRFSGDGFYTAPSGVRGAGTAAFTYVHVEKGEVIGAFDGQYYIDAQLAAVEVRANRLRAPGTARLENMYVMTVDATWSVDPTNPNTLDIAGYYGWRERVSPWTWYINEPGEDTHASAFVLPVGLPLQRASNVPVVGVAAAEALEPGDEITMLYLDPKPRGYPVGHPTRDVVQNELGRGVADPAALAGTLYALSSSLTNRHLRAVWRAFPLAAALAGVRANPSPSDLPPAISYVTVQWPLSRLLFQRREGTSPLLLLPHLEHFARDEPPLRIMIVEGAEDAWSRPLPFPLEEVNAALLARSVPRIYMANLPDPDAFERGTLLGTVRVEGVIYEDDRSSPAGAWMVGSPAGTVGLAVSEAVRAPRCYAVDWPHAPGGAYRPPDSD
jgi:hypothetical protein